MTRDTHEELKRLGIGKKVRALREEKNMSLNDLSDQVKLTPVLMAQIEDDVIPPTVATLLNISKTLGVGIDHFFTEDHSIKMIELTREHERLSVPKSRDSDPSRLTYNYQALSYRLQGKKMEPFLIEFDTETDEHLVPLSHDGEEFIYCLEGEIEFISDKQHMRLREGDSLYFFSTIPHVLRGIGPGMPKAIAVLLPSSAENK